MSRGRAHAEDLPTLVELLRRRAHQQSERIALTFLQDGETQEINLTYGELDERARAIGALLQSLHAAGERALLLYPAGLDFIAALIGCFYARVIAVPAYPPHSNRPTPRLQAIRADAEATLVLTTGQIHSKVGNRPDDTLGLKELRWIATDSLDLALADEWRDPHADSDTLAFLQYTSGSTSTPKGVMVSHGNLMANERMIKLAYEHTEESDFAGWLPLYHDMGLIGNVFQPLYIGARSVLMSPTAFLQVPFRWLQAMSRYRAHTSGAPNFAYDLCVQRVQPEQRESLDLSNWSIAYNGSEPIHPDTLERFAAFFEPCGFRREAFYPCYGLAEATLLVTGGRKSDPPIVRHFESDALEQNHAIESPADDAQAKALVGCGRSWLEQKIAIVNPESMMRSTGDELGEIWLAGPNITRGYWNQPEETERSFHAYIRDSGEGPFFRTGDIGFMRDGELFVTGRLKDLIIIRGRNHYPHDIERTTQRSHAALRQGLSAAFSVEVRGQERLVIVAEVGRHFQQTDIEAVVEAIRQKVGEEHELDVYAISLLKMGSLLKTTSGKIQHRACRAAFLAGELSVVGEWKGKIEEEPRVEEIQDEPALSMNSSPQTADDIQAWLIAHIASRTGREAHHLDVRKPFTNYGLDSLTAVRMASELGTWLGRQLSPTLVYEYPTIEALSNHLAGAATVARDTSATPESQEATREPIAIIGIGCRFPGAHGPGAFWQLLRDGVDAITDAPEERWGSSSRVSSRADAASPEKMSARWGGFLPQVDRFDASFFAISPREATQMDPQQRLLLETAWEALEDAGQVVERLAGSRTGVFVGLSSQEYAALQLNGPSHVDAYATTGSALSIAANRLSYFFDFRGPSLALDTACSSSLVAVHLACRSLWSGEATMALAGGANVILSPKITLGFSQAGAMSTDGRCKAFDASADGIVRSEGVGVVLLKPLSTALADGDPIYCVIRGSAIGQDGRSNGITAPSASAQEAVLRDAYRMAEVSPGRVQYVETHGTGTLLGDPIEASALGRVLAVERTPDSPCAIGSVKSNIGHTEAAAGVASIIKVALSIKHREIPQSLHFEKPNPHIPFEELQLRVQQSLGEWPEGKALAGVSAFGFGGTNAHVILEEAPENRSMAQTADTGEASGWYLLPLSAHNPEALRARASAYRDFLKSDEGAALSLKDICYTASVRRSQHDNRLAIVARTREELIERLDAYGRDEIRSSMISGRATTGRRRKLVFVCSGYGAQGVGMGRELFRREPVFREMIVRCDQLISQHLSWSLLEELLADKERSRLDGSNIEVTQVALFSIQTALAAVWRSWGIEPDAVVGHSLGEVAAAHLAGALTLNDAVRVICSRARLMQQALLQSARPGAMAAVEMSMEEAARALEGHEDKVSIAGHNTPNSVVMAGDAAALKSILQSLQAREIFGRLLETPGAGHSPEAAVVQSQLREALGGLAAQPARIPVFSTVTGRSHEGRAFDADYWARNVREPVLFSEAIENLSAEGYNLYLELSPRPILSPAILQCWSQHNRVTVLPSLRLSQDTEVTVLPSMRRRQDDRAVMLKSLATLYAEGYAIDWPGLYREQGRCVALPSYPWQRERYWITEHDERDSETGAKSQAGRNGHSSHPLLGQHLRSAAHAGTHLWEMDLGVGLAPYLAEHSVLGRVLLPATAYMEMALAAAEEAFGDGPHALEDVNFCEALVLPQDRTATRTIQLIISNEAQGAASFQFFSLDAGMTERQASWTLHARGKIRLSNHQAV